MAIDININSQILTFTDITEFPATGSVKTIYIAEDSDFSYYWDGTEYVQLSGGGGGAVVWGDITGTLSDQTDLQTELDNINTELGNKQNTSEKGVANGYASLDSGGKIPSAQLPNSVMEFKGAWDASTNTPTLANGTGNAGDVYRCSVAGSVDFGAGAISFGVGDWVMYNGSIWQHSPATDAVTSVNTKTGAVVLNYADVGALEDLNGTTAQYYDGTGALQTFPTLISAAKHELFQFINKSGSTITKGTIVYVKSSSASGTYPEVVKANASTEVSSSKTIGAVYEDVLNDGVGYVVTSGEVDNLDTSAYSVGDKLWLSTTDGQVTITPPAEPNHTVFIGHVTRSQNTNGRILYAIQNGYELDELHGVLCPSPSNEDVLMYESSSGLWKNKVVYKNVLSDTSTSDIIYIGVAPYGTATSATGWYISKIVISSDGTQTTTHATGIWDNRTSLSYS